MLDNFGSFHFQFAIFLIHTQRRLDNWVKPPNDPNLPLCRRRRLLKPIGVLQCCWLLHNFSSNWKICNINSNPPSTLEWFANSSSNIKENTAILIGLCQLNRIDQHREVEEQKIIAKRVKFSLLNWWGVHVLQRVVGVEVEVEVLSMESNHTPHHRYSGQMNRRMGDEGATRKHLFGSNYNAIPISIMIHCSWATGNETNDSCNSFPSSSSYASMTWPVSIRMACRWTMNE